MGDPYTDTTVTNYNDDAPADDGSQVPGNLITWALVKSELSDPLKTAIEDIVTQVGAAVDALVGGGGVTSSTAPYTVQATDQGKLVKITSAGTLTTATAATVGSPFVHGVLNNSSGTLTIDGAGSETVDGQSTITLPAGAGVMLWTDGTNWFTAGRGNIQGIASFVNPLPRGYIGGLVTSNDTDTDHDISIAAGVARDSTDAFNFSLTSAHVKRIDASWASGTGNGGLASGASLSANSTYHMFLVDDGSGNTEAGWDDNVSATNLLSDTGGSYFRRIASHTTDGSANIINYTQLNDEFLLNVPVSDYASANPGTAAVSRALSVPTGIQVLANHAVMLFDDSAASSGVTCLITASDQTDTAASTTVFSVSTEGTAGDNSRASLQSYFRTDTSAQIRTRLNDSNADITLSGTTFGWIDHRGKDA